jgi:hypothetical protein
MRTDANGAYSVANVPQGTYAVGVQPTPGHVGTTAPLSVTVNGTDLTDENLGVLKFSPVAIVPVTPNPVTPIGSGATAYVNSLYQSVLGRVGTPSEVQGWVDALNHDMSPTQVAAAFINSTEHRWDQVDYYYGVFLNRTPDPLAVGWVNALESGVSEQTVVQGIIMSPEFQAAHASDSSFISTLYWDVLGRPGSDAEIASWDARLGGGLSRSQAAAIFIGSAESTQMLVESDYASYLHQGLDPMAVDWINELEAGTKTIDEVAEGILTSPNTSTT